MTNETEAKILGLSNVQIEKLWPVLLDRDHRKEFTLQMRKQGVYVISATDEAPVYKAGVKRAIVICHMLGYSTSSWMCDDIPSVDDRKQRYAEIERDLCKLSMEHGGIILSLYNADSEEMDDYGEDNFDEYSIVECEFPTQEDAAAASQCIGDMWADFGVDVFDENRKLVAGHSDVACAPRTNKSPQKRVPSRLLRTYARLCAEKEEMLAKLGWCNEAGQEAVIGEFQLPVSFWFGRRDLMYSTARIAWHEAGLSGHPTIEQLDEWLGGNQLYAVDP